MCGDDVGLDKFNPTYFLINGVHNGKTQTDKRTVTTTAAGRNVLVRLANASYSKLHVTLDIDAWIVEVDGRPLRTNAAKGAFAKPKLLTKGTRLEVAVAQRYALWIPQIPRGDYRIIGNFHHWITNKKHFDGQAIAKIVADLTEVDDHAHDDFLKGIGRTAALAGVLMSGPALYFASSSTLAHEGHEKRHMRTRRQRSIRRGHASGHGETVPVKQEEDKAAGHSGGYGAHSGWPEPKRLGGDFSLTDHTGRKVTLADFKGKATAFYFGYTQCADICPIIGTKLGMAVDLMGEKADLVNIAMVSVDDRNDGPAQLAAFVAKQHPRLIGLSGTRKEIYDIAAQYRVRRDYVAQNQVAKEGEQQEGHGTAH